MPHVGRVLSVACCALLLAACHGRPLRPAGPAPGPVDGGPTSPAGEWQGAPQGPLGCRLRAFERAHPFVLSKAQLEAIHRARALRNPANWATLDPCPTAVQRAEAEARKFAGRGNPAKATEPGAVGLDFCEIARQLQKASGR